MRECGWVIGVVLTVLLGVPAGGLAQTAASGSIAGSAKDPSGAILPGVTVEAASPALIERVRLAVTDGQGNYKIVDLRPGAYTVTFTLPGFSTFRRDGVELAAGFTATVNADLRVGSLEETVTVTGASPVVDIQNVRQQKVLSRDLLDTVPTGKALMGYATLIVGARASGSGAASAQDVGGNRGEQAATFGVHGSHGDELKYNQDGMSFSTANNGGISRNFFINQVAVQEIGVQTGGTSAETDTGGVQINVVPKDGGNGFAVYLPVSFTNGSLQSENINGALRSRGLLDSTPVNYIYDVGFGIGGPVKRDRLWFYSANRWWGAEQTFGGAAGGYFNATPESWFYTADLARPAYRKSKQRDNSVRMTWQVAQKHKITAYGSKQDICNCYAVIEGKSPEASAHHVYFPWMAQASWTFPATNRLLFEGGVSYLPILQRQDPTADFALQSISVIEASTGLMYKSNGSTGSRAYGTRHSLNNNQRVAVSYITGSHAVKVGLQTQTGHFWSSQNINESMTYRFLNGVPNQITMYAQPLLTRADLRLKAGLYGQDQWTVRRLTMNLGARLDTLHERIPPRTLEAGRFVPARDIPTVDNVPNWKDLSPRLGAAYDVFGNGQMAVKASLGRYMALESPASANDPAAAMVTNATRTWTDTNRDFIPQESELGPLSNANFGKSVISTRWDPDELVGWGKRAYNWQTSASVQHELRPGVAVSLGYFRTWFGNFRVTDNLAVAPSDYSSFCITTKVDSRLPGGGGQRVCGLYDIDPSKFGLVNNLVTSGGGAYGTQTEVYNGVDLTVDARFGRGGLFSGGMSRGATVLDNCGVVVDSPQLYFCKTRVPENQVKFSGAYPLPWSLQASGTYQNLPGYPVTASYVATNAEIAPSLGRNLGACRGAAVCNATVTVPLIQPGTRFEDRINQVDLRLTKTLRLDRARVQGMFDVYNVFNANSIVLMNTNYGSAWLQPNQILGGRLLKFGFQLDY